VNKLANLYNTVTTINQYLRDIFNTFGGDSTEYTRAASQVLDTLTTQAQRETIRNVQFRETPTKPLQLSKSKAAMNVFKDVDDQIFDIRKQQRETGTAKQLQQLYIKELKALGEPVTKESIKQRASQEFELKNNINPYYEELQLSDAKDDDELKQMYSQIHDNWDNPKWRDEFAKMLRERYDSAPRKDNLTNISEKKKRAKKLSDFI
jgi:hypothetical protein